MEILAVSALCVCGVIFAIYFGESNKLFGQVLLIFLSLFVMFLIFDKLLDLLSIVNIIQEISGIDGGYTKLLLKMTGIIIVAEFTYDICEQAGYKGIGKQVLLFGRATILMVGYPILLEFIEMMRKLLV